MSLYERGDARYRVGEGCYAAVTCAERTQPAEGAQPLATARHNLAKRHNLGGADTTLSNEYEKFSIDSGNCALHLRVHDAAGGLLLSATGRDPSLAIDSVWRNTDILGLAYRH